MTYVAPSTVTTLQTYTSAAHNVIVNDVIALHQSIIRLAYGTRATSYTVSANMTQLSTAAEVFSSDLSFTADGTSSYLVECYIPIIACPANASYNLWIVLSEGDGTAIASLAQVTGLGSQRLPGGVMRYFYTPSAGTQTVNVRAIQETGGGNGELQNGASSGYTGSAAPMYLAIYGPPTV